MSYFTPLLKTVKLCRRSGQRVIVALTWLFVTMAFAGSNQLRAEQHVVSLDEIHAQIQVAHDTRADHLRDVRHFFSSDAVEKGLTTVGLDAGRVEKLVAHLDDAELARLAERTRGIERDLEAGALSNQHLTYIVIALATAVVVILAT